MYSDLYSDFYKEEPTDKIWWIDHIGFIGEYLFSFDKKHIFNLFRDYPNALTEEEKKIFDEENPYWKDFFSDREYKPIVKNNIVNQTIKAVHYEWNASGPLYFDDVAGLNVLMFSVDIIKASKHLVFKRYFYGDNEEEIISIPLTPGEISYFFRTISKKEKDNPSVVDNAHIVCDGSYWKVVYTLKDEHKICLEGKNKPPNIEYISNWIYKRTSHLMRKLPPDLEKD